MFRLSLVACFLGVIFAVRQEGFVQINNKKAEIVFSTYSNDRGENVAAWGVYDDSIPQIGWGRLSMETNSQLSDEDQAYALGYLEGSLTCDRMYEQYLNYRAVKFPKSFPDGIVPQSMWDFLDSQMIWIKNQVEANPEDEYWMMAHLMTTQLEGLVDGYNANVAASKQLEFRDWLLFNAEGDWDEILGHLLPHLRDDDNIFRLHDRLEFHSCSAFVKVLPDNSDIVAGHATWTNYAEMLRIFKFVKANYAISKSKIINYSSKPGLLFSKDDFYITSSGLVVMETTNSVFNSDLYDLISPETVLVWMRVPMAHRLSVSGPEWIGTFSRHQSGTYCNQWMILDTNKWQKGIQTDVLWIAEQIPGRVATEDVSSKLFGGQKYWPSYNVPAIKEIFDASGYPDLVKKFGDSYSYENCPRALIFKRDQDKVVDYDGIKDILRSNKYKTDPISKGNPSLAICARYDLREEHPASYGCLDGKVTSATRVLNGMRASAQSGPTHDDVPPFSWSEKFSDLHVGQPTTFDFDWVDMVIDQDKLD